VPFEPAGLFYGEARYRALIELSPQVIWMADAAGNITYTNRFWHQYSGLTYQQTVKEGGLSVVHPEDAENMVSNWRKAVREAIPFDNEARFRRASDGQYRWQLTRALPLKNEEGHVLRWVGISIDIHDRKIAAAALAGIRRARADRGGNSWHGHMGLLPGNGRDQVVCSVQRNFWPGCGRGNEFAGLFAACSS
jgi:PAS domain S-box-containing protein